MLFLYFLKIGANYSGVVIVLILIFHIVLGYLCRIFWKWVIIRRRASKADKSKMIANVPVVATLDEAASYVCYEPVDSIFVDCTLNNPQVEEFIDACIQMAVPIHNYMPAIYGAGDRYVTEKIGGTTVFTSSIRYAETREMVVKRCLDIIGGLVGSVIALIIMLIVGPFIKKASPGPILYT